MNLYSTFI